MIISWEVLPCLDSRNTPQVGSAVGHATSTTHGPAIS